MIAIVTDSTAYLTETEALFYGVQVVSSYFTVDGRLYRERCVDAPFYPSSLYIGKDCSTFQPSTVDFLSVFSRLAAQGQEIICLTLSEKLSRAYSHAKTAASHLPGASIRVVDTSFTVGGQFTLIKRARSYINSGLSLSETEAKLREDKKRVRIRFTVDELDTLNRSKRLSFVRRSANTALDSRPVFECVGGSLRSIGVARGADGRISSFLNALPPQLRGVTINYVDKTPFMHALVSRLRRERPALEIKLRRIGPVVGVNIGATIIAVSWFE